MNFSSHWAATIAWGRDKTEKGVDQCRRPFQQAPKTVPPVRGFTTRKLIHIQPAFTLRSKEGLNLSLANMPQLSKRRGA